ncbi:hypothetical protein GSI_07210 [Ganoderma sinense ZZ0214-1]|uniref:Uncharacterized protein n=1 Tax=Ganoderma sinense ZZ0214-1 TaxID=1077348 RepID=A0A2G8S9S2_9APHY|nr:hypothetical protein GSI_07210 [Ganoderma sinense ZZ0214-1]
MATDVDAQREATHFKNRVLDLIDIFVKKNPANPLIVRLIFPLVELIVSTGPDEKQLSDKATGILRNRIGKSKEFPSDVSKEDVAKTLKELHILARKASTPDVLATLNQASLYLSKVLLHAEDLAPVLNAYLESLHDFVARKASKLNTAFLDDFVKRHPQAAWNIRDDLVKVSGEALNGYRQAQVFHLIQTLVNQLQVLGDKKSEVLAFMTALRKAILGAMTKACNDGSTTLQPAHVKDILKLALVAARQTKRIAENANELSTVWQPSNWTELSNALASSDRLKGSVGLQAMCKQIVQLLQNSNIAKSTAKTADKPKTKEEAASTTKRKAADREEDGDEGVTDGGKKAKRKKARKAQSC